MEHVLSRCKTKLEQTVVLDRNENRVVFLSRKSTLTLVGGFDCCIVKHQK